MTTVVCDASPLLFLAKLDRLHLVAECLGERVVVGEGVVREVESKQADPVEAARLRRFLRSAQVVTITAATKPPGALSQCDQATLTWSLLHRPDWLLADERLLRRVAEAEGLRVMGFLGLLIAGVHNRVLSAQEARAAVNEAVADHGCRISIALYQRVMQALGG